MRMAIVASGRQTGKTTALVEQVRGGVQRPDGTWSRVIIVATEREAVRLRRFYGLHERQVICSQTWSRIHEQPPNDLYLDNLEDWLYSQLGQVPSIITTSIPVHLTTLPALSAAQAALRSALDIHGDDELLEDEDGAPYPEEVQALAREMRLKMREVDGLLENLEQRLIAERAKAERNEDGLLTMLGSVVLGNDDADNP